MDADWLTSTECALLLGVTPRCMQKWHTASVGPPHYALNTGGRRVARRYIRAEVIEWREKHLRRES